MNENKIIDQTDNSKIYILLKFIVFIAMIYASATPLNSLYYIETVWVYFIASSLFFLWSNRRHLGIKIKTKSAKYMGAFFLIILMTALSNFDTDVNYYLGVVLQIIASFFLVLSMTYNEFENIYIKVFTFISVYSTVLTITLNMSHATIIALPRLTMELRTGEVFWWNFHYIYYIWDYIGRFGFVRNSACFREPGVWGCFVAIALMIKILKCKQKRMTKYDYMCIIILAIGTLSSLSTTAIFAFLCCLFIFLFDGKKTNIMRNSIIFVLCSVVGIVFLSKYSSVLFNKFNSGNNEYTAYADRLNGVANSMKAFINNPFFGSGYTKYYEFLNGKSLTVSFVTILGEFGIAGLCWFMLGLLRYIKKIRIDIFKGAVLIIFFLIILLTQALFMMPIFLVLYLYGFTKC